MQWRFPNKVDAFPELEKVVTLPPLKEASAESENGDKKRRRRRG